jgi:hypothetical protein
MLMNAISYAPECGKILFNDIEAAKKFLRGQPIREGEIYPEDY